MKLAIPSETDAGLESIRSGHFGHTPYFTVVEFDDDKNIVSAEPVKNVDHDEYGCGGVIQYVMTLGVDGILTVGMGMPPPTWDLADCVLGTFQTEEERKIIFDAYLLAADAALCWAEHGIDQAMNRYNKRHAE